MTKKANSIDMSREAVAKRLEEIRGLCDLMNYLAKFRPAVEAAEKARKPRADK